MSTGFYSVIQFCPDAARQEAVNVGVVLFDTHTGYVGVKFTPTVERIRKFFGNVIDTAQLKVLGESVQQMFEREKQLLASADSFRALGERQANELRFTPPRKIAFGHPQTVLEAIYQRLVATLPETVQAADDQQQWSGEPMQSPTARVDALPAGVQASA